MTRDKLPSTSLFLLAIPLFLLVVAATKEPGPGLPTYDHSPAVAAPNAKQGDWMDELISDLKFIMKAKTLYTLIAGLR